MKTAAPPALSLLLLPEDGSSEAHATLMALTRKLLQQVEPGCDTRHIAFLPADDEARVATRGKAHAAKTPAGRSQRHLLAGKIAAQLLRTDRPGFVVYHADADRRWSERGASDFPDYEALRKGVLQRLQQPARPNAVPADAAACIDRFFLLAAYWELEAWLYQNLDVAIALCRRHDGGRHIALFEAWRQARAQLDEVPNVKESCCLGSRHNRTLAEQAFPAQAACDAGTSYAAARDTLIRCDALRDALTATRIDPS